jgi:hypothetical protein
MQDNKMGSVPHVKHLSRSEMGHCGPLLVGKLEISSHLLTGYW